MVSTVANMSISACFVFEPSLRLTIVGRCGSHSPPKVYLWTSATPLLASEVSQGRPAEEVHYSLVREDVWLEKQFLHLESGSVVAEVCKRLAKCRSTSV